MAGEEGRDAQESFSGDELRQALEKMRLARLAALKAHRAAVKAAEVKRKVDRLTGIAMTAVAVLGLISVLMSMTPMLTKQPVSTEVAITERIATLEKRFSRLEAASTESLKAPEGNLQLHRLQQKADDFSARLGTLEQAISKSPERALSIPLLRKDVDVSISRIDEVRHSVQALSGDLALVRGLVLTGMGALLLLGLSLIARNLFRGKVDVE